MINEIRSIGFDFKDKKEFENLAFEVDKNYDEEFVLNTDKITKIQKIKYFGETFGVMTTSNVNKDGHINITSVQPYFETAFIQRLRNVTINEVSENVYVGYGIEEYSNVVILFFIQNNLTDLFEDKNNITGDKDVKLYAVSDDCKVILRSCSMQPSNIEKKDFNIEDFLKNQNNFIKSLLNHKNLHNEEITMSNLFGKLKEYIHYIGKNKYEFLGTITSVETGINKKTNMKIYKIVVDISGIYLDVLINENDIYGLPILGMRLFGSFRLCGEILKDYNV